MGNLHSFLSKNKITDDRKSFLFQPKKFEVLWLLATHPHQTFTSEDILNTIMEAGMMIHEKEFVQLLTSNLCRKAGRPFLQKSNSKTPQTKNKFL